MAQISSIEGKVKFSYYALLQPFEYSCTFYFWIVNIFEPCREKTCLWHANNKGADQPAHSRSLISAFVVRCLDSIIPLLALAKISRP